MGARLHMVGRCSSSCSCMCSVPSTQEDNTACETPPSPDFDILQIIEEGRDSSLLSDDRYVCRKEWSLKISKGFTSVANHTLISFANKLTKLSCGSVDQKRLFLSAVSGRMESQPFKYIEDIIAYFVKNIQETVVCYVDEKIESVVSTGSGNYADLKKIITEKAEETIREKYNVLELTRSISREISDFYESEHISDRFRPDLELEIGLYTDVEEMPFSNFLDLYCDHLEENYHYLVSRYVEIFNDVAQDEEWHISLVFDTFIEHMIYYKNVPTIRSTFYSCARTVVHALNNCRYNTRFRMRRIILDSEIKMRERMEKLLLDDNIVVIYRGTITACNKEIMEEIIDSSMKYLKLNIDSYTAALSRYSFMSRLV